MNELQFAAEDLAPGPSGDTESPRFPLAGEIVELGGRSQLGWPLLWFVCGSTAKDPARTLLVPCDFNEDAGVRDAWIGPEFRDDQRSGKSFGAFTVRGYLGCSVSRPALSERGVTWICKVSPRGRDRILDYLRALSRRGVERTDPVQRAVRIACEQDPDYLAWIDELASWIHRELREEAQRFGRDFGGWTGWPEVVSLRSAGSGVSRPSAAGGGRRSGNLRDRFGIDVEARDGTRIWRQLSADGTLRVEVAGSRAVRAVFHGAHEMTLRSRGYELGVRHCSAGGLAKLAREPLEVQFAEGPPLALIS